MRFKRNYLCAIRRYFEWVVSRFKPLTVHTEAIMLDEVWEQVQKQVKKNKIKKWYIMTPKNKDYFKSEFNLKKSDKELSKIMKERYIWMLKHNQTLELHIHLSHIMGNITYLEQEKLFKDSISWIKKELKINVKEFVPGWWSYNKDTLKICEKYKLKMIFPKDYDFTHDFHWI